MQTIAQDHPFARTITTNHTGSRRALWAGRAISSLAGGLLLLDSAGKLLQVQPVIDGTKQLGYPPDIRARPRSDPAVVCAALYLVPRTSALGALLLTGYLGGAVATHVRVGNPLFTHVLAPTYVAALLWGGLVLRDPRLRALLPWHDRRQS